MRNYRIFFYSIFTFFLIISNLFAQDEFDGLDKIVIYKNKPFEFGNKQLISFEDIKNLPVNSVSEIFSYLGIDIQERGALGVQSDFSIRGSTFQQVLILINGMRVNDPQTAHHNSDLPVNLDDIERIEVYPTNSNVSFGLENFAGTINIITKKPKDNKYSLRLSGGNNSTFIESFNLQNKKDNLSSQFSIENKESKGFRYDTDFKILTVSSHHAYDFKNGNLSLDLGYNEKEFGAYDFYTPAKGYPSKEWTKTEFVGVSAELKHDRFSFFPKFYWRRHFDKFMLDKTRPSLYLNHHRTDVFNQQISAVFPTDLLGDIVLGEESGEEKISSTNLGKHARNYYSLYFQNEKEILDNLFLSLGSRYDHFEDFDNYLSPLVLLKYNLALLEIHFLTSKSIRRPSFTELYYNDPTTEGDSSLSAEKAINYEIGAKRNFDDGYLGLNFFYRQEDDLIDWAKTNPSDTKWKVRNIGRADVAGIDFYGKINLDFSELNFKYTFVNRRLKDKAGYLPKYGPISLKHYLNIGFDFDLFGSKETITFIFKKRPTRSGWLLNDLRISKKINDFDLFLNIDNIFNVEYQDIEGIPCAGRIIQAGVKVQW